MNRWSYFAIIILQLLSLQNSCGEELADTPIRVGILHSHSGTMSISERPLVDAIMMAIDEVNERGGVLGRPLDPFIEDGQSDAAVFAEKAEKLIVEDRVASVFGCWTSDSRKAVLPIFEKHNHLLWYPVQYEGQESSPNIIYTGATPNQQISPAVTWCRREFGPRMFLVGSDYVFPRTANQLIKLRLLELDATAVGEEYLPLGSDDFDEIVAKIKRSKADVVLNTINGDSNLAFFRALEAADIDHRQIPVMSFSVAEVELQSIGVELMEGHYCSWNYFQSIETPTNRRFVREFRKRYGADRVTDDPIEAAYLQVHLFAKAVEKAGSTDPDAIRLAARGMIYSAPEGLVRIDPRNQHTWKVSRIGRIKSDGQFQIVWTSEDPLPPLPFLPEIFLATAAKNGDTMFTNISVMIALEMNEPLDRGSRDLLALMADVRGFLGNARAKLRSAVLVAQSQHRIEFELAWSEFDRRFSLLEEKQDELSEEQRDAFAEFKLALHAYTENANSMFATLYPAASESTDNSEQGVVQ